MHNHRRRKKQPHAMRSIELLRSRAGYGFTISGQQPCVLSCIVTGSPADCAGLKTGDYLMVVNGLNVSNASHDDVVRLIGSSLERLDLEIAENYNSSDSSEEDFQTRPKSKYPNRRGRRTQGRKEHQYVDGTDLDNGALGVADRYSRLGGLHPEMGDANEGQDVRSHWQRVEQVEHRLGPSVAPLKYRGQQRPKHTIITRETRLGIAKTQGVEVESGPRVATASITSLRPSQDAFVPVHSSSQVERPTVGHRRQVNALPLDNIRAMVGYVGSIEMPALARPPSWRTQSLKGAVRRLRIEQKMHTSVLMHINCDGVHLLNAPGKTIAHYPADNIVSCGVCPDDKRFFGLMTLHRSDANCDGTQSNILLGSSCHVFSIDPQLNRHSTHVQKAHSFNIQCTMNPTTNCCAEFPPSTTLILQTISRLCCNLEDALEDAAMAHVELSEDSAAAANRYLRSNSNSSTSDSGVGCASKEVVSNKVCVVEMPVETKMSETIHRKSSSQSTKYSCSSARDAVRVSLATSTYDATAENSDIFYTCSDAYRGGNYTQRSRPDTHVQPHSKRSRPAETQRSVSQVQMALQKALPVTRHPFDTDGARFRQPSTQYQSTSMLPPPLPAKHTQGAFRKTARAALPVAPRVPVPVGMVMVSTPQSRPASRIAKFSRPKSTPPFMTDDHWEVDVFVDAADYESDPGDSCATGRSDASIASATLPRPRRSRHFGNDVGVINEKSAAKSLKQLDSVIVSENSKTGGAQQCVTPPAGCATSWAVNFNNLLSDKSGLAAFTDFLKKEFSEENIKFWNRCEHYKQIEDDEQRQREAQEIFSCHLATSASDAVNVDSFAQQETRRGVQTASPELFDAAQRQIYQLMKHDSYVRFLKSNQYKACIMAVMEGKQPPYPADSVDEVISGDKMDDRKKIKKSKSTTAAEEGGDERRRRSLLPWVRNKSEKRLSRIATDSDLQRFVDGSKTDGVDGTKSQADITDFTQICQQLKAATPEVSGDRVTKELFCRVCLPGDTTTVICPVAGQSLLSALVKVCERRKLCLAQYAVLHTDSDKPVDLTKDVSTLGCVEVKLVRRAVVRVDIPTRSLAVKACPEKSVRDVLRPVLLRYGIKPTCVVVYLWTSGAVVNVDTCVQTVDNQRLVIKSSQDSKWTGVGSQTTNAMKPPIGQARVDSDPVKAGLQWQATHRQLFKDVTKPGRPILQFDETGIWDPDKKPDKKSEGADKKSEGADKKSEGADKKSEGAAKNHGLFGLIRKNSVGEKDGKAPKGKMKPPPLGGNNVRPPIKGSRLDAEDERFLELLSRVQGRQLDDQRGLKPHDLQLPDFLKPQRPEDPRPPSPSRESTVSAYCLGAFHPHLKDDNRARHSCLGLTTVNDTSTLSSGAQIQFMDQSFSQDGILPSHDEAEAYFTRPLGQAAPPDFTNQRVGRDRESRANGGSLQIYMRTQIPSRSLGPSSGQPPHLQQGLEGACKSLSSEFCANNTDDFKCQAMQCRMTPTDDAMEVDSIPNPTSSYGDQDVIGNCFLPLFTDGEVSVMDTEPSTPSPTTHDLILGSESSPEAASSETSDAAPTTTVSILKKWVADKVDSDGQQKTKKNLVFAECEANGDIQVSFV